MYVVRPELRASLLALLIVSLVGFALPAESYATIWDDDGENSGIIALLFLLVHPAFDVKAATVAVGEADPPVQAARIAVLLEQLGYNVPVFYGRSTPLVGDNAFPQDWRDEVNRFFDINLSNITCNPNTACNPPLQQNITAKSGAAEIIYTCLDTLMNEYFNGVIAESALLFAAGPLTNIYEAYQMLHTEWPQDRIEEFSGLILESDIMGGAVNVPGNLKHGFQPPMNDYAEFNIWIDPVAAAGVFQEPDIVHMTPLDVTDQISWTQADIIELRNVGTCESLLAADLLDRMIEQQGGISCWAWDLVAAALSAIRLTGGSFSAFGQTWTLTGTNICIDVVVSGANQGWTRPCPCPCNSPNAFVYDMHPALAEALKEYIRQVFAGTIP